ncbi:putative ferredoxin-like protein [Methanolinea mesophila]|uniref:ferredoxin domain-containing protein n=1 Tax=Methanolinea mesophila TaxID=547055 RepID=UPI001AE7C779|nr:DUF2148 domain-containing protein [Methanolinea mesophila]MBP1927667.1 putative ferredoxin-like protein [Methanolinea mesophila]
MNVEQDATGYVLSLMALSARTAPKGKGMDSLAISGVRGNDLHRLAEAMREFGQEYDLGFFQRDAGNIEAADACLLIGARGNEPVGVNCQGCGHPSCQAMAEEYRSRDIAGMPFRGPNCVVKMADLGIAIGSAVKTASMLNMDNRVMYSAGVGGLRLGWLGESTVAYGIPLKGAGKNIFFDRG